MTGVRSLEPDKGNNGQQKQCSTPEALGIPRKCGQKECRSQEGGEESWEMLPSGQNRAESSRSQHQVSQKSNMGGGGGLQKHDPLLKSY